MQEPTVNENPTVLSVDTRRNVKGQQPLEAFRASSATESIADLAVRQALTEASIATQGKGVNLLKNLGIDFPDTLDRPSFVYAPLRLPKKESAAAEENTNADNGTSGGSTSDDEHDLNSEEVFEIIRNIQDPEHPLTLEQLGVVSRGQIVLDDVQNTTQRRKQLEVRFTPTIPHCSMATQIGLCLRVKLDRSLPPNYKSTVKIEPGSHASENAINKQLADKERVCAALENKHLLGIVNKCIMNGMAGEMT